MARDEIDLSGTHYDTLETQMSQYLGVKVILVRDWSDGGKLDAADAKLQFANTRETWTAARNEYLAAKEAVIGSLRSSISERDPAVAAALSDTDVFALKQTGHVTLRKGNTEGEQAVIIFDPVKAPARSVAMLSFGDASGNTTQTVNLTTGGGAARPGVTDKEAAIATALSASFDNLWDKKGRDQVAVSGLLQNFDIELEDLRRYKAYLNVQYALSNQDEYAHQGSRDMPRYLQFAHIVNDGRHDINTAHSDLSFRDVTYRFGAVEDSFDAKEMGFKDQDFFKKLKLAGAVMDLVHSTQLPNDTFARLDLRHTVNDDVVREARDDLHKRLEAKVKEKFPKSFDFTVMQDWRALFPVFREVYEADTSTGVKREYLDTVMQGLQKYFPTITNAPVPTGLDNEPPRTLPRQPVADVPSSRRRRAPSR